MGRKMKGITRASLEYSNNLVDNLENKDNVSSLELRKLLAKAYTAGYNYRKDTKKKYVDSGVWLAITEFAFHHEAYQLLEEIIHAMGFSYEECLSHMEQNDTNREVIEFYVNSVFRIGIEDE